MLRIQDIRRASLLAGVVASTVAASAAVAADPTPTGPMYTLAGTGSGGFEEGLTTTARLSYPRGVAPLPNGHVLVADTTNHRVRQVGNGAVLTVAGAGGGGLSGDGMLATLAHLDEPVSVAPLTSGGFLIADRADHRIRRVSPAGLISTVAGTGDVGDGADNQPAQATRLNWPNDVSPTADGGLLIADTRNHRIRKILPNGVMRIVAGDGDDDFEGDGGQARQAELKHPRGVAALPDGGFLIADTGHHRIRRVSPAGIITTVAGKNSSGYSGDHVPATAAKLQSPTDVVTTENGGFAIADWKNHRVRYVGPDGIIRTLAGTGTAGFGGDGGPATAAALNEPRGIGVIGDYIVVADKLNHRIRAFAAGIVQTVIPPRDTPPPPPAPPAPVAGKRVTAAPVRGEVSVKKPGSDSFVDLATAGSVPVGSVVDTRQGAVRITSAANLRGKRQSATFHGATFKLGQKRSKRPVTQLVLRGGDFSRCRRSRSRSRSRARGSALADASRKRRRARRGLWGRGKGRFRTRGRHGAATVRGTIWFTGDSCKGTIVRVKRGVVAVDDFARRKRVLVKAGRSYMARRGARGRRSP